MTVLICILVVSLCPAQVPQSFKYQAIARDAHGNVISNQQVSLKINLLQGSRSGQLVYSEIHNTKTNQFGLINLEIGKGNFNTEFKPLSNKDILGNSLLDMRDNLKKAEKDEEGRKQDDELRNWTSFGLAKFSEILRKNNDNIEELSFDITSNILEYLDAIQGAIFIINDADPDDVHFELKSAIAYNRKKFINKKERSISYDWGRLYTTLRPGRRYRNTTIISYQCRDCFFVTKETGSFQSDLIKLLIKKKEKYLLVDGERLLDMYYKKIFSKKKYFIYLL